METNRTTVVKLTEDDYDNILVLQRNELSRQYLGGPTVTEDFREKFKEMLHAQLPESYWVVRQKDTNAFMGLVCITKYHDQLHYEVSYELLPNFWGDGYGTEIIKKILDHGFNTLGLQEIYAETQKKNLASIRLLEKVGMQFKSHIERFGEEQIVYSIKRPGNNL